MESMHIDTDKYTSSFEPLGEFRKQIAKGLLKDGVAIDIIARNTYFTIEEVRAIKKEIAFEKKFDKEWAASGRKFAKKIKEAREEASMKVAKNMLARGASLEDIAHYTGLSLKKVKALKAGLEAEKKEPQPA
jgi:hypothetical protein